MYSNRNIDLVSPPLSLTFFPNSIISSGIPVSPVHPLNVSTKFIKDEEVKVKNIFKGDAADIIDLPEKKYTINKEAFLKIESYKQIL